MRDLEHAADRLTKASIALLRSARPIEFRLAESDHDRRAAYALRYRAVIDQGWRKPQDFPDGLEHEPGDDFADHMIGWLNGEAIANCRITYPVPGRPLPFENEFGLLVEPAGNVVQIDRICSIPVVGFEPHLALPALMSATWLKIRRHGSFYGCGPSSRSMLRVYRFDGIEYEILGPAQFSWGENRFPVRFSPLGVTSRYYDFVERQASRSMREIEPRGV